MARVKKVDIIIIGLSSRTIKLTEYLITNGVSVLLVRDSNYDSELISEIELPKKFFAEFANSFRNISTTNSNSKSLSLLAPLRTSKSVQIIDNVKVEIKKILERLSKNQNFVFEGGDIKFINSNKLSIKRKSGYKQVFNADRVIIEERAKYSPKPFPGFSNSEYLMTENYEDLVNYKSNPESIVMFGIDQESLELADLYSSLGVQIYLIDYRPASRILPLLDRTAFNLIITKLLTKKVEIIFGAKAVSIKKLRKYYNINVSEKGTFKVESVYIWQKPRYLEKSYEELEFKTTYKGVKTNRQGNPKTQSKTILKEIIVLKNWGIDGSLHTQALAANLLKNNIWSRSKLSKIKYFFDNLKLVNLNSGFKIVAMGKGEKQAKSEYGGNIKVKNIRGLMNSGFVKIVYKDNNKEVVGITATEDYCTKYSSQIINLLQNKQKLSDYVALLGAL